MLCTFLKLRCTAPVLVTVLGSISVAHAEPPPHANPFIPKDSSGKISASVSESVDQVKASSQLALQDAHFLLTKLAFKASEVVTRALDLLGVRYRWGGNTPVSGFDCSGFVRYVFQNALGLTLPRRAAEMSRIGKKISVNDLAPGDLVFFNTRRRAFSHVGIFIGGNRFVHSPSTGHNVRIDALDSRYWGKRFNGARRLEALLHLQAAPETVQNTSRSPEKQHTLLNIERISGQ